MSPGLELHQFVGFGVFDEGGEVGGEGQFWWRKGEEGDGEGEGIFLEYSIQFQVFVRDVNIGDLNIKFCLMWRPDYKILKYRNLIEN